MSTQVIERIPDELRSKLVLALDVDDVVEADRLTTQLRDYFGVVKVGLELFCAGGADVVAMFVDRGWDVFLDLKLNDIPNTVNKAARVCGSLGVKYLTLHAFGGQTMLRAGVEGLNEGAAGAGFPAPTALGVTILTSTDDEVPAHVLGKRVKAALEGGCGGIVCSALDVREAKHLAPRLVAVVPGIRAAQADTHDQVKIATPEVAFAEGADLIVVGRAVTGATDKQRAASDLFSALLD